MPSLYMYNFFTLGWQLMTRYPIAKIICKLYIFTSRCTYLFPSF